MSYVCNPININYRYQFNADPRKGGEIQICREAADPSMILFKGRYYIFASMTLGVWVSDDLVKWENHRLPDELPLYDYAPDVRVMGDYVYFCASKRDENCDRFRTKDILNGPYEKIPGNFPYWDPNLFIDDDGKVYFYWGCSNTEPIYGCELDPETMLPKGEKVPILEGHPTEYGYERVGEDNSIFPASQEEIEKGFQGFLAMQNTTEDQIPDDLKPLIKGMFSNMPYIEGAWVDKHNGKYYLQYAFAGTQFNTYGDGVYVSDSPLGPYKLAENNPYSYNPGGFLPGAGHGSTMEDKSGNLWHTATMRISVNHDFERRVGLWPAGFDKDGELFCNQRYGNWPFKISGAKQDPWKNPDWFLLSYDKKTSCSSALSENPSENVTDEDVQTLWRPASTGKDEWITVDLGNVYKVNAVQINFGDGKLDIPIPGEIRGTTQARFIDDKTYCTRWKMEGSVDGEDFFVLEDKSEATTDLTHDLVVMEEGREIRYIRVSNIEVPYGQIPALSGIRVFGKGEGELPKAPVFSAKRDSGIDMSVKIEAGDNAVGHVILWGSSPEKLYHSWMVLGDDAVGSAKRIGALVTGRDYYLRVDSFNESGITEGEVTKL
ncbi:family 43 glycosylhydrolase [Butyrivibrio sp. AE3006]|uniref:family 43 glycosylhydrolase n=1 Tax=Butyrivibrio sp. AE3006 TaxID=1280673 RepID=UPI000400A5E6|nr:family 43 glycosylhydrolase [Butyrivibrio sp. AE3006]